MNTQIYAQTPKFGLCNYDILNRFQIREENSNTEKIMPN